MLGGSFNPPHVGHLVLADEVIHQLGYTKVIFVPARVRPLKVMAHGAHDSDRIAMTKIAIAGNPAFCLDTCEMEREGPSYTYDTIVELTKKYQSELEGKIGLIMGEDLIESFGEWFKHNELAQIADIILARRVRTDARRVRTDARRVRTDARRVRTDARRVRTDARRVRTDVSCSFAYPHIALQNAALAVSSTEIRDRIQQGLSWRYLAGEAVYGYIRDTKLYGYTL
jgi:nicotinate-nucleotide adenylyltransferase